MRFGVVAIAISVAMAAASVYNKSTPYGRFGGAVLHIRACNAAPPTDPRPCNTAPHNDPVAVLAVDVAVVLRWFRFELVCLCWLCC